MGVPFVLWRDVADTPCPHYCSTPATLGIRTRDLSQEPLHCTTRTSTKNQQTTAVHCLKTNFLQSGILLEFAVSAVVPEQPMKGPVATAHKVLNILINKTQDISEKILVIFSF